MESEDVLPDTESNGVEGVEEAPEELDAEKLQLQLIQMGQAIMIFLGTINRLDDLMEYRYKNFSKKELVREIKGYLNDNYNAALKLQKQQQRGELNEQVEQSTSSSIVDRNGQPIDG